MSLVADTLHVGDEAAARGDPDEQTAVRVIRRFVRLSSPIVWEVRMRRILYLIVAATWVACAVAPRTSLAAEAPDPNPNPALFAQDAHPYGASMATWGERASQWIYGEPYYRSPLFDQTGANCGVDQQGPVWYIARIAGPPVFSGTRHCTIPHQKALFLYIGAIVDVYPCPDPNFQPAPGQSLYDFLSADAKAIMDTVNELDVSLDGQLLNDVFSYRYHSDDLFSITGDLSLRLVMDSCITGQPQPAIVDGFFMMFKPLDRGEHVVRVHGTATGGDDKTFTYFLKIT